MLGDLFQVCPQASKIFQIAVFLSLRTIWLKVVAFSSSLEKVVKAHSDFESIRVMCVCVMCVEKW